MSFRRVYLYITIHISKAMTVISKDNPLRGHVHKKNIEGNDATGKHSTRNPLIQTKQPEVYDNVSTLSGRVGNVYRCCGNSANFIPNHVSFSSLFSSIHYTHTNEGGIQQRTADSEYDRRRFLREYNATIRMSI